MTGSQIVPPVLSGGGFSVGFMISCPPRTPAVVLAALAAAGRAESAAAAAKLALAHEVVGDGYEEFAACEVATALSVSSMAARNLAYLGDVLAHRLPRVRRALERGDLDLMRVRAIIDRTQFLTDPARLAEAEHRILAQVLVAGRCTTRGQTEAAADKIIATLDPSALIQRRRKAVADRCLDIRADLDGMSSLYGSLPAADGTVVDRALRTMATGVCGADPRTLAQRRADTLTAWAAGHTHLPCTCGSPDCPDCPDTDDAPDNSTTPGDGDGDGGGGGGVPVARAGTRAGTRAGSGRNRPVIQVVVDAAVLLGAVDLPGVLAHYGIIDPETVRTLAADARWQRMLTTDGVPIHLGRLINPGTGPDTPESLRYTPSERLAALVRTRDFHCRFPGCTSPAATADLDHVIAFNKTNPHLGGRTVAANLACLCRWHHRAKTDHVWNVTMTPDGTQHWTGPHEQHLHTTPTGMPPTSTSAPAAPPGTTSPVLPPHPATPTRIVAPDADDPPDEHPPPRFTPDGHWADDPCTPTDLDALEALFDTDLRRHAQLTRTATAPGRNPTPRPPPPGNPTEPDDEPPPF